MLVLEEYKRMLPEDGWYNATHLTKEAAEEFTRKLIDYR